MPEDRTQDRTPTTQRVLTLLDLLQRRSVWTGAELADELCVTIRSVRRDVDRLRDLGYPVESERGAGGGYRLGSGRRLPPLLLDDREAVAVAIALRLAAGGAVAGRATGAASVAGPAAQPPRFTSTAPFRPVWGSTTVSRSVAPLARTASASSREPTSFRT